MPPSRRTNAKSEEENQRLWQGVSAIAEALRQNHFDQCIASAKSVQNDVKQLIAFYTAAIKADTIVIEQIDKLLLSVSEGTPIIRFDRAVSLNDQVVAKVASHDLWVLARVFNFQGDNIVDVQDIDDEHRHYSVHKSDLILLPHTPSEFQQATSLFQPPSFVFAMYPDTTSFYKAQVVSAASQFSHSDEIQDYDDNSMFDSSIFVRFADDENDNGLLPRRSIPLRFVTHLPSSMR
mmetsp:Transcript_14922/g.19767  ORF Transcript_14922/g.19767 Transcript_14922/m.19767 type:complete len:235 (+) Transcript_14922:124-828(+)|eukprot:CAMPEP_0197291364 /NCGR_PEP_ID=MMETSP0890-20130614/14001_1 /TAXON_ID=44058 ORGANISM="Aureoumbra lagunensis, Strain CCMP1510" /NCGR_SAMPLE_ID=MMETSP0890 /ASSEMBLY_ACC=CAM_ASM_000533 /LENGTH=234 /DNA_ID=CAMNT_0042764235 /DNA_START=57 /DNA_END=761 /DNA_ORIENTATION=-